MFLSCVFGFDKQACFYGGVQVGKSRFREANLEASALVGVVLPVHPVWYGNLGGFHCAS